MRDADIAQECPAQGCGADSRGSISHEESCVAGLALACYMGFTVVATSARRQGPTIKEIMTKAHKGGDSLDREARQGAEGREPKWDDVQKQTKELVELGSGLGKNDRQGREGFVGEADQEVRR